MLAAEDAIRQWVNGNPALVPQDGDPDSAAPISRGAYLRTQRSPADGTYLIISRAAPGGNEAGVAEVSPALGLARITAQAYAGTEEAAEAGAAAYARAVAACTGVPQPCGTTGIWILSHDQLAGPAFIAAGPNAGETYSFQVVAEFLLAQF